MGTRNGLIWAVCVSVLGLACSGPQTRAPVIRTPPAYVKAKFDVTGIQVSLTMLEVSVQTDAGSGATLYMKSIVADDATTEVGPGHADVEKVLTHDGDRYTATLTPTDIEALGDLIERGKLRLVVIRTSTTDLRWAYEFTVPDGEFFDVFDLAVVDVTVRLIEAL